MDGVVDHVCRPVEQSVAAAINNLTGTVDEDQVRPAHLSKGTPKRVDPEVVGLDGVTQWDVSRDTFVEAELSKEPEGEGIF